MDAFSNSLGLTLLYLAFVGVGIIYAVIILVGGAFQDIHLPGIDLGGQGLPSVHLDFPGGVEHPEVSVPSLSPVTVASFVTAFGAFGLIGLGLFNATPAWSLAWAAGGGLVVAVIAHFAFGYFLIAAGVFLLFGGRQPFAGIWLALIGWFLSNAAEATVAQISVEHSLRGIRVREVMESDPPSVSPNETVADLVNERLVRGEHRSFLVRHDDGGLAGIVTLSDVRRMPRENWEAARVTDIMTRYADLATIGPDAEVEAGLKLIQEREVNQLPVVEKDGRTVLGLLTRAGILRLIEARMRLGV